MTDLIPPERDDDLMSAVIPYRNRRALSAYYCGLFSLLPCVGAVLGPVALILGTQGLEYAKARPEAKGRVHALVGIVLGAVTTLANWGFLLVAALNLLASALFVR
jgi:hypothetical protein